MEHLKTTKKDSDKWDSMSRKSRVKALRKTGSWQEDYKTPLKKMGGSQQDVVTQYVYDAGKKKQSSIKTKAFKSQALEKAKGPGIDKKEYKSITKVMKNAIKD